MSRFLAGALALLSLASVAAAYGLWAVSGTGTVVGFSTSTVPIIRLINPPVSPDAQQVSETQAAPQLVSTDLEQQFLARVNAARAAEGNLPALVWDEELAEVARGHSRDMVMRAFFDHENPDGLAPADRIQAAGIMAVASGENIAKDVSVEAAHNALMNSPGHRANILSEKYSHAGIGILQNSDGMLMVTQLFRRAPCTTTSCPVRR